MQYDYDRADAPGRDNALTWEEVTQKLEGLKRRYYDCKLAVDLRDQKLHDLQEEKKMTERQREATLRALREVIKRNEKHEQEIAKLQEENQELRGRIDASSMYIEEVLASCSEDIETLKGCLEAVHGHLES